MEFKGKQEDIQALKNITRAKVGRLIIQKTSMFGLGNFPSIYSKFYYFFWPTVMLEYWKPIQFEEGTRILYGMFMGQVSEYRNINALK